MEKVESKEKMRNMKRGATIELPISSLETIRNNVSLLNAKHLLEGKKWASKSYPKKGIEIAAGQFSAQIVNDQQLAKTTKERITLTQQLMQRLNISGVPLLLVSINGQEFILHGADLYNGPSKLINSIKQIVSSQK